MRTLLILTLTLMLQIPEIPAQARSHRSHPTMQVRISVWSLEAEMKVRSIPHIDILDEVPPIHLDALIYPEDLPLLRSFGFNPVVVHRDVEAYYASRLKAPGLSTLKMGSMGGFLTWAEILAQLDAWRTTYPDLITARQSIGKTLENRDQWMVKVSANADVDENEPEIYLETLIHAREPQGMMCMMRCIEYMMERYGTDPAITDLLDNREIWFVPVMNVDGYEYNRTTRPGGGGMWRKNRRPVSGTYGIDLNRNFGYKWGYDNRGSSPTPSSSTYRGTGPFSEPAAANVRDFLNSRLNKGITSAWDIHTYSGYCMYPYAYANVLSPRNTAYSEITADMVAHNKFKQGPMYSTLYTMNGCAADWFEGTAGLWGWLPEIGWSSDGFWPATSRILALTEENLNMLLTAIKYAGPYLVTQSLSITEVGNSNGNFDPGEKLEVRVTVRNRGVVTATSAQLKLVSSTPYALIEAGTASLGTVPNITSASNTSSPLRARIPGFTPPGTRLRLEVQAVFNGHTLREPVEILVGTPNVLVNDTCETATWTRGLPGDDAVRGMWTWGDPYPTYATSNNRYAVQTGDDHTPGAGTRCYVTGNQSTTNGDADDVDAGKTTLVTPALKLASALNPYVEYWRWFMDHGPTPNNDTFVASVSNDGGLTWKPLETVNYSEQAWKRNRFRLRDFVKPTDNVMVRFVVADRPDDSFCEALVDDLKVIDFDDGVRLTVTGSTKIGATAVLNLTATRSAGRSYLCGAALGDATGIPVEGGRTIPLDADPLLYAVPLLPDVFKNFSGTLSTMGTAQAAVAIPAQANLVGISFHVAFLTVQPEAPGGIRDISASVKITISS